MALLCLSQCNRAVALVPEMDGAPIHVTLDAHREPGLECNCISQ